MSGPLVLKSLTGELVILQDVDMSDRASHIEQDVIHRLKREHSVGEGSIVFARFDVPPDQVFNFNEYPLQEGEIINFMTLPLDQNRLETFVQDVFYNNYYKNRHYYNHEFLDKIADLDFLIPQQIVDRVLRSKFRLQPNQQTCTTLLMLSIFFGEFGLSQYLLSKGSDPLVCCQGVGDQINSPLLTAILYNGDKIGQARQLIELMTSVRPELVAQTNSVYLEHTNQSLLHYIIRANTGVHNLELALEVLQGLPQSANTVSTLLTSYNPKSDYIDDLVAKLKLLLKYGFTIPPIDVRKEILERHILPPEGVKLSDKEFNFWTTDKVARALMGLLGVHVVGGINNTLRFEYSFHPYKPRFGGRKSVKPRKGKVRQSEKKVVRKSEKKMVRKSEKKMVRKSEKKMVRKSKVTKQKKKSVKK